MKDKGSGARKRRHTVDGLDLTAATLTKTARTQSQTQHTITAQGRASVRVNQTDG